MSRYEKVDGVEPLDLEESRFRRVYESRASNLLHKIAIITPWFAVACLLTILLTGQKAQPQYSQMLQLGSGILSPPESSGERNIRTFFDNEPKFQSIEYSHDAPWDNLTPHKGLFLRKDASGLGHAYGMSMFHQLHCLAEARRTIQKLYYEAVNASALQIIPEPSKISTHVFHCLDYVRQAVLCNADETIENQKFSEYGVQVVNGMEARLCRNSARLYEMLEAGNQF